MREATQIFQIRVKSLLSCRKATKQEETKKEISDEFDGRDARIPVANCLHIITRERTTSDVRLEPGQLPE